MRTEVGRRPRVMARAATTLAVLAGLLLGADGRTAAAQQASLDLVDRLTRAGRMEEARAALLEWEDDARAQASRSDEQRALWLRARLTVDPEQAMLDYQRLVVLYPGGPFTDQALLRLAQAAHALGDEPRARAHVEALARDHPASPARRAAEAWLASAGTRPMSVESDVRTAVAGGGTPPPAGAVPAPVAPAGLAGEVASVFSVQLGAFSETRRAEQVRAEAAAAGFEVRLVQPQGSGLLHVRVGRFADRGAAEELLGRIVGHGLEGAIVRDDRPERPIS